jgi:hypothetical protein
MTQIMWIDCSKASLVLFTESSFDLSDNDCTRLRSSCGTFVTTGRDAAAGLT